LKQVPVETIPEPEAEPQDGETNIQEKEVEDIEQISESRGRSDEAVSNSESA
jgi:hypothetical protein